MWNQRVTREFYGPDCPQRKEDYGSLVNFAGHVVFETNNTIHARILNPNIEYEHDKPDTWIHTKHRFVSGKEPGSERAQLGQAIGHLTRVLDHSSPESKWWVIYDMFYVVAELKMSGWKKSVLQKALSRLENMAPGLAPQSTFLCKMLNVWENCASSLTE